MSVRIGQMTDIHVRDFSGMRLSDWFGKRMTGWVNYQSKRAKEYSAEVVAAGVARLVEERPDLVVVSGDLTNVGLETELVAALRLLAPLREAGVRTVVFPGNHDMYVTAATRGGFERVAADWQIADARGERPYLFVVRAGEVSCVCFNSAIPVPPVLAYGRLGRQQLDDAARLCAAERSLGQTLVFAVHHHATRAPERPAEWMRNLRDVAAFRRLAAEYGAVLVLHGHNHYEHTRRLREAPGVVVSGSELHDDPD